MALAGESLELRSLGPTGQHSEAKKHLKTKESYQSMRNAHEFKVTVGEVQELVFYQKRILYNNEYRKKCST